MSPNLFSDKPFIYKVTTDGTMMLYSVSANLKDDNGTASRNEETDIVIAPFLRLPVPAARQTGGNKPR